MKRAMVLVAGLVTAVGCDVEVRDDRSPPKAIEATPNGVLRTDVGEREAVAHERMVEEARLVADAARRGIKDAEGRAQQGLWAGDPWGGSEGEENAKPWARKAGAPEERE